MDMSTPLLPEAVPEIDANPVSFHGAEGEGWVGGRSGLVGASLASRFRTLISKRPS